MKTQFRMELNAVEMAILKGDSGETQRKAMESIVRYGELFGATRLVSIDGAPHLATSFGSSGPHLDMVAELVAAGLRTTRPFTVNPRPTPERWNVMSSVLQTMRLKLRYRKQDAFERQLARLGLRDEEAFSCTCYLPEVGNIPRKGAILCWSGSSAVAFANSMVGARTNRNSAGIDILCNVLGKTPFFGLLTDEGRKASWQVEVKASSLPNPQVLGRAIGLRVVDGVPYIKGLSKYFGRGLSDVAIDYFKDMGAAAASSGAVGLFHVENITPEALEMEPDPLLEGYRIYVVDDAELARVADDHSGPAKETMTRPDICLVGCPHLSLTQLRWWSVQVPAALQSVDRTEIAIDTVLCAAPGVIKAFREYSTDWERLAATGARISSVCPLAYLANPISAGMNIATNSIKLRTHGNVRFFQDADLLGIMVSGTFGGGME